MKKLYGYTAFLLLLVISARPCFAAHVYNVSIDDVTWQLLQDNATAFGWTANVSQFDPATGQQVQVPNPNSKDSYIQKAIINNVWGQIRQFVMGQAQYKAFKSASDQIQAAQAASQVTIQ